MHGSSGSSLMEMVIVLAILSLLATMAAPYATKSYKRDKEIQLRQTLRTVRMAIDEFHTDMKGASADNKGEKKVSPDGYPFSLQILVDGIEKVTRDRERGAVTAGKEKKKRKRYLRALPVNPFAPPGTPYDEQWTFVSYQIEEKVIITGSSYGTTLAEAQTTKKDIYDLHPKTAGVALDGTRYADW